ncbi:MAG: hypothetical protein NEA02_13355 [Thermoanaerobaculia bacterium]|nr:hypothetical protein [Thermoanaerobaculia bacterium]
MEVSTAEVFAVLSRVGVLLKQDKRLPSVVTLVAGESLATSWWSHRKAHLIFSVLSELSDHPDVLFTKLLYGKDTFVHRGLWPVFLAVATSREPWQRRNLSLQARKLLLQASRAAAPVRSSGPAVKELVSRLLVRTEEVHTESGKHEMAVETWTAWAARVGVAPVESVAEARQAIEAACQAMGASLSALPWAPVRKAVT